MENIKLKEYLSEKGIEILKEKDFENILEYVLNNKKDINNNIELIYLKEGAYIIILKENEKEKNIYFYNYMYRFYTNEEMNSIIMVSKDGILQIINKDTLSVNTEYIW